MRYEIKAQGVGEILDQAIGLLKNHFGLLMGISLCFSVPFALFVNFVIQARMPVLPPRPTPEESAAFLQELISILPILMGLGFVSMVTVYPLTTGAMIHAVASKYLGKPTTIGASIGRALRVWAPLLWTSILVSILVSFGLLLCFLPGVLLFFRYALSSQAVVLEGVSGLAAMKRSKALMGHEGVKNYATLFLLFFLLGVIGIGIQSGAGLIPQQHVGLVVTVLLQTVGGALGTAALAVFYFSCRCKAENFDLLRLVDAMQAEPPEPTLP